MSGSVDPDTLYTKQNCIGTAHDNKVRGPILIRLRWRELRKGVQRVRIDELREWCRG